ncbi:MAG TPA: hypothetical protein VNO79_09200 [Actinomycetota bacterium]|nr:hypothetical protein [Actinomycetota bacterium]
MAITQDGQVTEMELQYARRVLRVLAELLERDDPEVAAMLRALRAALGLDERKGSQR